jgi:hypothetical protein
MEKKVRTEVVDVANDKELKKEQPPLRTKVNMEGEDYYFNVLPDNVATPLALAMVVLRNSKVDKVLDAFGVVITDITGKKVYPREKAARPATTRKYKGKVKRRVRGK